MTGNSATIARLRAEKSCTYHLWACEFHGVPPHWSSQFKRIAVHVIERISRVNILGEVVFLMQKRTVFQVGEPLRGGSNIRFAQFDFHDGVRKQNFIVAGKLVICILKQ
jgi:hypothetical protein